MNVLHVCEPILSSENGRSLVQYFQFGLELTVQSCDQSTTVTPPSNSSFTLHA